MIREGGELFVLFEVYEPGVTSDQGIDIEASEPLQSQRQFLESEPVVLDTKTDAKTPSVPVQPRSPGQSAARQLSMPGKRGR